MTWKDNPITDGTLKFAVFMLFLLIPYGLFKSIQKIVRGFLLRPLWDCGYCDLPSTELFGGLAILGLSAFIPFLCVCWGMKPLPKRAIIVSVIVWAISLLFFGYHTFITSRISDSFSQQQNISEAYVKRAARFLMLRGKVVIIDENGTVLPEMMLGLHSNVRANNWQESQTLIRVQRKENIVGVYTNGTKALQPTITITVIDNVAKSLLGEESFVGGQPSDSIKSRGITELNGSPIGPDPDMLMILNWINSLPRG